MVWVSGSCAFRGTLILVWLLLCLRIGFGVLWLLLLQVDCRFMVLMVLDARCLMVGKFIILGFRGFGCGLIGILRVCVFMVLCRSPLMPCLFLVG